VAELFKRKLYRRTEMIEARRLVLSSDNTDEFTSFIAFNFKYHLAVSRCKQGMILSATDVIACMKTSAALTDNNVSSRYRLTAETLDAQPFRIGIAAVTCTTASFLVSHNVSPIN
jgi:hypothetical protein